MLKRAFGEGLRREGFERKGPDWYLRGSELIAVVNLQKDDFSDAWFVNLGIWITALGEAEWPKSHTCHVQIRVPRLWPDRQHEIAQLFDLEREDLPDDEWCQRLESLAQTDLAPVCRQLLEKSGLVDAIKKGEGIRFRVMLRAYHWLGIPLPK